MDPASSPSTQVSLVERVRQDDPLAWQQFVELYAPLLFYWARRDGLSSIDAADVTQDALAAIARSIGRFDPHGEKATLRGWMRMIVRNKVRDFYRHRPAAEALGGTDSLRKMQSWPEAAAGDNEELSSEDKSFVHRALGQIQAEFEPRTWEAFWKVVVDGRDTGDVASQLGISRASVRQAKSRVLRRLRDHLGPWFGE